jgi:hypothetical protein
MWLMVLLSSGFYCRQKGHCGKGMTFSINPTAAKTQADFQAAAIAQNGTGTPSAITGGQSSAAPAAPPPPPPDASAASASLSASVSAPAPTDAAAAAASSGVVAGVGSLQGDGSCACTVLCAAGSFPAAAQGLNAFGGVGGSYSSQSDITLLFQADSFAPGALPMTTATA